MAEKTAPEETVQDKPKATGGRFDFATIAGLVIAFGGILGGLILEGGRIQDVAQFTAAVIVLGGTLGAVMVSTPSRTLKGALRRLIHIFRENRESSKELIEEILRYATKARKSGVVSLEEQAEQVSHPFLRKALNLAVDGTDMQELRAMMQLEMEMHESRAIAEAKVFDSAGGYAPTIGIIGAVLGLIQVMKNLANIEEVGHGIAVAFVATVYGVGLANILLIPAGNKIRARIQKEMELQELMLEGVLGILEGLNPKLIRSKLEAFAEPEEPAKPAGKQAEAVRQTAPIPS